MVEVVRKATMLMLLGTQRACRLAWALICNQSSVSIDSHKEGEEDNGMAPIGRQKPTVSRRILDLSTSNPFVYPLNIQHMPALFGEGNGGGGFPLDLAHPKNGQTHLVQK